MLSVGVLGLGEISSRLALHDDEMKLRSGKVVCVREKRNERQNKTRSSRVRKG